MSRSRRRTPICSIACRGFRHSEKLEKRLAHRRRRKWERAHRLSEVRDEREFGNPWTWTKDGKDRFDAVQHPECLRK